MSETEHTNFLGIPVIGSITAGEDRKDQYPLEQLAPLLQAVLKDETVERFSWIQYTPYFNDGAACVFHVTDARIKLKDGEILGHMYGEWQGAWPNRTYVETGYAGPNEDRWRRWDTLETALTSGHYDNVLLEKFGDHARINVTREKITVEYYEHD